MPRLISYGHHYIDASRDFWSRRQVVYRCFDADGALLYIGVSGDICTRVKQHRSQTSWWHEVSRVVIRLHPNRTAAFAAEIAAIRAEHPRYNVRHKAGWIEPRARRRHQLATA